MVLTGEPTVRHADGEVAVRSGDVVCFADGPGGAHRIINRSQGAARLVLPSTTALPVTGRYPDTGKILIRDSGDEAHVFRIADGVDYWEREADPGQS